MRDNLGEMGWGRAIALLDQLRAARSDDSSVAQMTVAVLGALVSRYRFGVWIFARECGVERNPRHRPSSSPPPNSDQGLRSTAHP